MRLAVHAEWTKLRTLSSTAWLLLAVVVCTVTIGALVSVGTSCPTAACGQDPARLSLTGIYLGQAVVAILAVLTISAEYGSGMVRTTLSAVPDRLTVLAAKAVVLTGLVLSAGGLAVLGSVVAGRLFLSDSGWPADGSGQHLTVLSLTAGPTLRAAVGSVLYLVLIALLSLGIATAVRDSGAAIGCVLGLLYLFPILAAVISDPELQRHLRQIAPMSAGLAVQATVNLTSLPIGPWPGLGVLAAWAAGAMLLGALVLRRRDA
jgi:ABC-2 type transport system permease protein